MMKIWFAELLARRRGRRDDGLFSRLRRDVRGNTLAIAAAALFPLAGMVGGGIDLSRMYLTKTRMQHACDAGALAGRKAMGSGVWSQSSYMPRGVAERSYDANFPSGAYGAFNTARSFAENAGVVTGTASSTVPMTLMRVLGFTQETLDVTCRAEMRLPNTDVMFVLDTTGSMDQPAGGGQTKMEALKVAVKCFYEIVARLDTNANCTTGAPSGGTGNQVQIRFGFVPYSTNVNVGRLLNAGWMADTRDYQTRTPRWWVLRAAPTIGLTVPLPALTSRADCRLRTSVSAALTLGDRVRTVTTVEVTTADWVLAACVGTQRTTIAIYDWREGGTGRPGMDEFIEWRYAQLPVTVAGLKNGSGWNASFQWPIGPAGTNARIGWDGCIEERQTVRAASYDPIPAGAIDLDIDRVPNNDASRWGPVLPDVIFTRNAPRPWSLAESVTAQDYRNDSDYICPQPARKLQQWPAASDFEDYVDTLTPSGNTYHDIGLLWGARLMSATGLFRAENEFTPRGGEIERNLIFMTDGDPCTGPTNYTAYGVQWYDRRTTDPNDVPTGGCTTTGTLTEQVNARTDGLCTAIKNKNITLWVVAFGDNRAITAPVEARLQACATTGRYFRATDAATLQQTFKAIADQISMLRLTQ